MVFIIGGADSCKGKTIFKWTQARGYYRCALNSGCAELHQHVVQMRAIACFDHQLKQRRLRRQIGEGALKRDLNDVGAGLRKKKLVLSFWRNDSGATAIEYGLI